MNNPHAANFQGGQAMDKVEVADLPMLIQYQH